MKHLHIQNFGPIQDVNVEFGDLTLLVGAQASGKSLSLELLKLLVDRDHIISVLDRYNYIWGHDTKKILDMYFGEGMNAVWGEDTSIMLDDVSYGKGWIPKKANGNDESLFYIPAQRILSISDGRPKNFMEFDNSSPYVLRMFSETLRLFMQNGMGNGNVIFPLKNRLKGVLKNSFNQTIFHNGKIIMEETSGQKKMKMNIGDMNIPFMAWSAGQKEFMPLLLAFYCLSGPPSKVVKREKYKYVVLEEPEMGLHPKAILSVLLQVIELIQCGYKVIISTHSTILLEFAWAFNTLKAVSEKFGNKPLYEIFKINENSSVANMMDGLFENKTIKTYYFKHSEGNKVISMDISDLDPSGIDVEMSEWGGLSEFSSHVSDVVSKYMLYE